MRKSPVGGFKKTVAHKVKTWINSGPGTFISKPSARSKSSTSGGTKLSFASTQNHYLPDIYSVPLHPRIPDDIRDEIKRILVIPWPVNDQVYNKFYFHYAKQNISIPAGHNSEMDALGWGHLEPGDIVFLRDLNGSGDGKKDSFEGYVFEVAGKARCFGVGLNHQKPRNINGPAVGGKIRSKLTEEEEEHTSVDAAVNIIKKIIPEEYKHLEETCELHNVPRIGTDGNVLYQGIQLNLAQPEHEDSSDANGIKALGFFGGIHFDKSDSPGGYTTLLANSDLPDDWKGGRFHLVEFGLYVVLDGITASTFTGLRLHGGTPPLAPAGAIIPSWAYQWVIVLYPQGATLDGRVNMNLYCEGNEDPEETIELLTSGNEIKFYCCNRQNIERNGTKYLAGVWPLAPEGTLLSHLHLEATSLLQRCLKLKKSLLVGKLSAEWQLQKLAQIGIDEIAHAAHQAPDVLKFNKDNVVANMAKKRKCQLSGGGKRKCLCRLIEDDEEELSSDNEEDGPSYQVARFIEHRQSADPKRANGYEYLVEWVEDGSQSWAHKSLIDAGPMYEEYQQCVFMQIIEVQSVEAIGVSCIPFMMAVSNDSLIQTINLLEEGISHWEAAEGVTIKDLYQQANRFHVAVETSPLELKTITIAVHTWELFARHWIMEKWEIYPKYSAQSLFLSSLMNSTNNPTIFLLNAVWDAYNSPSLIRSSQKSNALPSGQDLKQFEVDLSSHAILRKDCSSEIKQLFTQLWNAHWRFIGIDPIIDEHIPSSNLASSFPSSKVPPHIQSSLSSSSPAPNIIHTSTSSISNPEISHLSSSTSSSSSHSLMMQPLSHNSPTPNSGPSLSSNPCILFYCDWLIKVAEVFLEPLPQSLSDEQTCIVKNLDKNCPFRELAPGRAKVTGLNSIFTSQHINTCPGIFSALIFQGILFNTEALRPTVDELAPIVSELGKGAANAIEKMGLTDHQFGPFKDQVQFDGFMVEHSLCKFSRDQVLAHIFEKKNLL
ncbi:hypothetical protein BDP27DRAFT_1366135 [Rhodocollybia butyracea]|uniref:Chromo domain-containing protein n=1 Tax=Rhodocollybia butyracea TaxID=206335 RepID=A0A9P5PNJ4_9AGAR|nr:hypothetical protein BDP27DRAFT_1366135 [Rhodocollybia butyracea]